MAMKTLWTPKKEGDAGKAKAGEGKAPVSQDEVASHPPTMYLEHEHLKKLGMKEMPAVGEKLHARIEGHVGAVSEDQDRGDGGEPRRRMTLHVHKMEVGTDGPGKEVDQQAESAKGAKAEMDKALKRGAGGSKKADSEGEEDGGETTPRGGGD
jgi:hypothetical protein